MKRILVPVDFSPNSKKAFRLAVDIASKSGGAIILYHLFMPGRSVTVGSPQNVREYNKQLEENNLKRLQRLKKKVLEDTGNVSVSTVVGRIPVVDNILRFAKHNQVDMIVMGTQGANGIKKIAIGSVAAKVVAEANVPVLLVPERHVLKEIKKIAFATIIRKTDREALPVVFELALLYDALVILVNFLNSKRPAGAKEQKELDSYTYYIQQYFDDARVQFQQLKSTSAINSLKNLHEEIPYDLLVMTRRKLRSRDRFFQKSFTKGMAYTTTRPLLVIPEV